ncbi:MAG: hypothetical protein C4289_07180, partial [Chloroflexota bacterium]
ALPPPGYFYSKAGPVDARIFRKETQPPPAKAVVVAFHSEDTSLYDPVLDVSGSLLASGGATTAEPG